jgi:transposase InsO family protein
VSRDLDVWAYQRGVTLDFSRPRKPTDNAFIEAFTHHRHLCETAKAVEPSIRVHTLEARSPREWAMSVLNEAGAIRECEEHGWMQDRADPHARERALEIARRNPLVGLSDREAVAAIGEVLAGVGDAYPECPRPE